MTTSVITDAALLAHARGFTPIPIRPDAKAPTDSGWGAASYESADEVVDAFQDAADRMGGGDPSNLNIGLALGSSHGDLVNIDIDHWRALGLAEGILPHTAMRSGRPGRPGAHYWYLVRGYDPGIKALKLPNGGTIVEYRAKGGQTVIPPSVHPEGEGYEWHGEPWGGEAGPTELGPEAGRQLHAACLMMALLVTLADAWPGRGSRHSAYLALVGGLLRDADENGRSRAHPWWDPQVAGIVRALASLTHDPDGAEARVKEAISTTRRRLVNQETVQGWPSLATVIGDQHVTKCLGFIEQIEDLVGVPRTKVKRDPSGTPLQRALQAPEGPDEVVLDHSVGQWPSAAERDVEVALLPDSERDPLRERLNEWEPLDLGPYVRGGVKAPEAGVLHRDDGLGLFYLGRVNSMFGEGGSGKTLLSLHTALEYMNEGHRVMLIDFEDEPHNTLRRFMDLGADLEVVADRFIYIRPEMAPLATLQFDRWGNPTQTPNGRANEEALAAALTMEPSLIIVDGTTTLYRLHGLDTNSGTGTDVVGGWLRRLTDNGRRTVILIDHTGKAAGPGSTPVGSQHKIAMVMGTAIHVYAANKPRPGEKVTVSMYLAKDRPGDVSRGASDGQALMAAEAVFDSTGDRLVISVKAPTGFTVDTAGSTVVQDQQDILDCLRGSPGVWMTKPEILAATGGRWDRHAWLRRITPLMDRNLVEASGATRSRKWRVVEEVSPLD